MKVLLVNGSLHEKGCTHRALCEVQSALEKEGVESEIFWIGRKLLSGCIGCGGCRNAKKCVFDDVVNEFAEKAKTADGFVFGSAVHYASTTGSIKPFMDRLFYSSGSALRYKPASAIVSCRRGGSSATLDVLQKYFTINCMPVVSSSYWNMVHGASPEEVERDEEGLHTMRTLGYNMAWLIRCIEQGKRGGIEPRREKKVWTNFIRNEEFTR